ncbi:MAG: hypothetical protein ACOYUZ_05415 [Patescibacteria group bacterium]
MITRIIFGLIIVALGAVMVIYTNKFYDFFGSMNWADRYLGAGGSRLMYKFIGIIVSLVGFMWMTNLWEPFLKATLGSILPR